MNKRMYRLFGAVVVLLVSALLFACQTGLPPEAMVQAPDKSSTGNPPLIPHEVDDAEGGAVCQECHRFGAGGAPHYPDWHAVLTDCKQCHVPSAGQAIPFIPAQ